MDVGTIAERQKGTLSDLLGIRWVEADKDRLVAEITIRDDLRTVGGALHGGAIMAFADTLGAVATFANLPEGARTTTIESKTNFVGAASAGTRVSGESVAIHKGRTTMVWQTTVRGEGGKLVALVTQTQLVIAPAAKSG